MVRFTVVRYGVAVLSVAATVILALWLRPIVVAAAQLLLVAILLTGWVSGLRPALVAWVLATLAFAYYFTPPFDSLKIDVGELRRVRVRGLSRHGAELSERGRHAHRRDREQARHQVLERHRGGPHGSAL